MLAAIIVMASHPISRRRFLSGASTAMLLSHTAWSKAASAPQQHILIGNMGSTEQGIYRAAWNPVTGELHDLALHVRLTAPTFMAFHPIGQAVRVFAVSEGDEASSAVNALLFDRKTGALKLLNSVTSRGSGTTHVAVSQDGGTVVAANYGRGSITSYKVAASGELSQPVSHLQYTGRNADEKPHAHCATFSLDGRYVLINDLGLNRICTYKIDHKTASLTPAATPVWEAHPGAGPRHLVFHPNGRFAYSVNELDSTVDLLSWNSRKGELRPLQTISSLKPGFPANTAFAGEILISADGRHVYVGNRVAEDSIAVFDVDHATGKLTLKQLAPNGGKNTRHIALDGTGRWLIASNQGSNEIVVFRRDPRSGEISEPIHRYAVETPMFAAVL